MSESTTKQAIGPNQEKWLKALESGEYAQGRRVLCNSSGEYCCLGVACEIFGVPSDDGELDDIEIGLTYCRSFAGRTQDAPREVVEALALIDSAGKFTRLGVELSGSVALAPMNDDGKTFAEIAAFCRKHPEAVFTEPR